MAMDWLRQLLHAVARDTPAFDDEHLRRKLREERAKVQLLQAREQDVVCRQAKILELAADRDTLLAVLRDVDAYWDDGYASLDAAGNDWQKVVELGKQLGQRSRTVQDRVRAVLAEFADGGERR